MSGTIIVGVDGSDTALHAAKEAARIAAALGAKLCVVMGYEGDDVEMLKVGSDVYRYSTQEESEAVVRAVSAQLDAGDLQLEIVVSEGKPADVLIGEAKRLEASIIVVGNRRMQGVARLLGSVANDVAHHAPCDVYIVKTT